MANFIKRENLGSGAPPRIEAKRSTFSKGVKFGVMQEAFKKAQEEFQERKRQEFEGNAEVQRHRTLTAEEKGRNAIEHMIPTAKAVVEMRTGKECSHEDARKFAENIAYKGDRMKSGE